MAVKCPYCGQADQTQTLADKDQCLACGAVWRHGTDPLADKKK